jgi:hypothetical protein
MGHPPPAALIDSSVPAKPCVAIGSALPSRVLRALTKPCLAIGSAVPPMSWLAIALLACSTEPRKPAAVETRAAPDVVETRAAPDAAVTSAGDCAARVRAIAGGDLSAGQGLPAGCRLSAIEPVLGARGETGSGSLSFHVRPWQLFDKGNVRVWLESETDDHVLRIDIGGLASTETGPSLEAKLGKPSQRVRSETNPGTRDWIYPDRGLTLSILGSSSDPRLRAITAYAPTTLADYNDRLGGTAEPVRR